MRFRSFERGGRNLQMVEATVIVQLRAGEYDRGTIR